MMILFVTDNPEEWLAKAEQLGLFDMPVHVAASVDKHGRFRAAHIARRKVRAHEPAKPVPHSADLFGGDSGTDSAKADPDTAKKAKKLTKFLAKHGGAARMAATLKEMTPEQRAKLIDAMAHLDGLTVGDVHDLLGMADHGLDKPTADAAKPAADTVTMPRDEAIQEHERLVSVLESPSHADDKIEAKKQAAELAEYKQGDTAKPVASGKGPHEVPLDSVLVKWVPRFKSSVPPAVPTLASAKRDAVFVYVGDVDQLKLSATVTFMGQAPSEYAKATLAKMVAAQKAGYSMKRVKTKSGTGVIFERNGKVLTPAGADALMSGTFTRPDVAKTGDQERDFSARLMADAKMLAKWMGTLPLSTLESPSAFANKLNNTPMGRHFRIGRDDHGSPRIEAKDDSNAWRLYGGRDGNVTYEDTLRQLAYLAAGDESQHWASQMRAAESAAAKSKADGKTLHDVLRETGAMPPAETGPKDGDRNADGLIFRDGRWHREGDTANAETPTAAAKEPDATASSAPDLVEYTTKKGKVLRGIVRKDIDGHQAKAIDPYTFRYQGGWFIREKHLAAAGEVSGAEKPVSTAAESVAAIDPEAQAKAEAAARAERAKKQADKLREVADKTIAAAQAEQNRDRNTNTARRARMASGILERAAAAEAIGQTMHNLANAIESGEAQHLSGVTSRAAVEELDVLLIQAMYQRDRSENLSYAEQQSRKGRGPEPADIMHARLPRAGLDSAAANRSKLLEMLKGKRGAKGLIDSLRYTPDLTPEKFAELKKYLTDDQISDALGWYNVEAVKRLGRLARMGIDSNDKLRMALTEYVMYRNGAKKPDPVKTAEMALVGQKVGIDFFPTPKSLASRMAELAGVKEGMRVLEPSAGNGNLADAAKAAGGAVDTYEVSDTLRNILKLKGHNVAGHDFMDAAPEPQYDAVIMNPPFSNRMDAEHIQHAWGMVKPGGKLVAIAGEGVFFGSDKKAQAFRDWLDQNGADVEKLPEGTFLDKNLPSTTGVNARLIVLEKPAEAASVEKGQNNAKEKFVLRDNDGEPMSAYDAAKYLKSVVYSLKNLDGVDDDVILEIMNDIGKGGRDSLLMDAFGISRYEAHNIHNSLDGYKPVKLRAVDMEDAFNAFPALREIIEEGKKKANDRKIRRAAKTNTGPKDGDRNAEGLIFRDGRWHRDGEDVPKSDQASKTDPHVELAEAKADLAEAVAADPSHPDIPALAAKVAEKHKAVTESATPADVGAAGVDDGQKWAESGRTKPQEGDEVFTENPAMFGGVDYVRGVVKNGKVHILGVNTAFGDVPSDRKTSPLTARWTKKGEKSPYQKQVESQKADQEADRKNLKESLSRVASTDVSDLSVGKLVSISGSNDVVAVASVSDTFVETHDGKTYPIKEGKVLGLSPAANPPPADTATVEGSASSSASSAAQRSRPKQAIVFRQPVLGPSGAALVSYEWQWKPLSFIDNRGEDRTVRISDWDGSVASADTGRDIVHHFSVKMPDGEVRNVSAESAIKLLGYGSSNQSQFKSVASAAKTLARLQMKLTELIAAKESRDKDQADVDSLPLPEISKEADENGWWYMGDAKVRQFERGPINSERKRALIDLWRTNRMSERGWGFSNTLASQIADTKSGIQKAQKKLDSLTASVKQDAGPREGDRNADGLVFRNGRWHREDVNDTSVADLSQAVDSVGDSNDGQTDGANSSDSAKLEKLRAKVEQLGGKEKVGKIIAAQMRNSDSLVIGADGVKSRAATLIDSLADTFGVSREAVAAELGLKKKAKRNPSTDGGRTIQSAAGSEDDPNSPNYRFRDTGYIANSRKEMAANMLRTAAKEGRRVNANEVDWESIEHNPREAKELIVKSNLFGQVPWDSLKEQGMEPSAGFLIDRVYASIAKEPEDNPQARKDYALGLQSLRDRLEKCKTPQQVTDVLKEIRDEQDGVILTAEESADYAKHQEKISEMLKEKRELETQCDELYDKWYKARGDFYLAQREVENRKRRGWKPSPELDAKLQAATLAHDVTHKAWSDKLRDVGPRRTELEDAIRSSVKAANALQEAAIARNKVENPLSRAWNSLGDRFKAVVNYRRSSGSDAFRNHVASATGGNIKDWSWAETTGAIKVKRATKEQVRFQLRVAENLVRKGGRAVKVASTEDLKRAFGLRDVQSGNWVLKDPASAKFHVENCAAAFSDLADLFGVPDEQVSMNGRLAMAFGARGAGAAGGKAAKAHYEPVHRVINLTKMAGGGSLAHEWAHALDNMVKEAVTGETGKVNEYASENPDILPAGELRDAFRAVRSAMLDSDGVTGQRMPEQVKYTANHIRQADYNINRSNPSELARMIAAAGNAEAAVIAVNGYFDGMRESRRKSTAMQDWKRIAVAYYDRNPDGATVATNSGPMMSSFAVEAMALDAGGKPYWAETHEMFARAFHAYVEDKLAEQGRESGYLASYGDNKYHFDPLTGIQFKPFPEGEERKRINAAFDKLVAAARGQNVLAKALARFGMPKVVFFTKAA